MPVNRLLFIKSDFAAYGALIYSALKIYPKKKRKRKCVTVRIKRN